MSGNPQGLRTMGHLRYTALPERGYQGRWRRVFFDAERQQVEVQGHTRFRRRKCKRWGRP